MATSTPTTLVGDKPLRFEFGTASRILFGNGVLAELPAIVREYGTRAFVLTGKSGLRADRLIQQLAAAQIESHRFALAGEPTVAEVLKAREEAARLGCAVVIGFGGGSAIDAAKAVSGLLTNPGDPMDYLEVVGRAQPLTRPAAPCIAIPTTAGTGAEVTRNAVLTAPEHQVKVSLRGRFLLPQVALVDPELSYELPAALTAMTGLDALTQLIEPYVSCRSNPLTDGFCLDGIRRVARSLEKACSHPNDAVAREDMSLASLQSGLALANSGLGAVHGLASPIGGLCNAPHGAVCSALLASVMETNIQALRLRAPNSTSLSRFRYIARLLVGKEDVMADACVSWVRHLTSALHLPRLRDLGVRHEHFSALIDKSLVASSMKANPIPLTSVELKAILDRSW